MDMISAISTSISLVQKLREISKNIIDADFKNLLADLSSELGDVKLETSALKDQLAALQEENRVLKQTAVSVNEKPIGTKWGSYQFEGDTGLYCTGCWDSQRKKIRTNRLSSIQRLCPVCGVIFGSR